MSTETKQETECRWKDIPAAILPHLRHLKYTEPVCVLHELNLGDGFTVRVIGDPGNGAYEWLISRPEGSIKSKVEFSDCGYGCSDIALRDGLIAYFGLPNELQSLHRRNAEVVEACRKVMTCAGLPDSVKDLVRQALRNAKGGG